MSNKVRRCWGYHVDHLQGSSKEQQARSSECLHRFWCWPLHSVLHSQPCTHVNCCARCPQKSSRQISGHCLTSHCQAGLNHYFFNIYVRSMTGPHNLRSFLVASSTQIYFLMLSFFMTFATKVPYYFQIKYNDFAVQTLTFSNNLKILLHRINRSKLPRYWTDP